MFGVIHFVSKLSDEGGCLVVCIEDVELIAGSRSGWVTKAIGLFVLSESDNHDLGVFVKGFDLVGVEVFCGCDVFLIGLVSIPLQLLRWFTANHGAACEVGYGEKDEENCGGKAFCQSKCFHE